MQTRLKERSGDTLGLRFDKVALRFAAQMQDALDDIVPDAKVVIVTITAPLRQPSKTATELIEHVRLLCARSSSKKELHETRYGNSIVVRVALGRANNQKVIVSYTTRILAQPSCWTPQNRS